MHLHDPSQILAAESANTVRVQYAMTRRIWDLVVVAACPDENLNVEHEGSEHFIVEYASLNDFYIALNRLHGTVEYLVLPKEHEIH